MGLDFSGRHIVVTGGTGALGTAITGLLLEAGASVHIPVLDAEELARFPYRQRVRTELGVDLTDEAAVERFYGGLAGSPLWASIHIAGGFGMSPVERTSKSDFVGMMQMNALTCFLCSREAVRLMKASKGDRGGRIVNVAARPGVIPELGAGMAAYAASKAAVAALTQALGAELAAQGILVNAVVPSIMDTPANRRSMPEADHGRWPKVEDVARTIAFLASPGNTVTRGGLVPVYGRS
jgi:NAD(P)-dependent dehydrogenase (short-subunit alcohol dehydrogenase family)